MKKDVIIAVIVGFFLGATVALIFLNLPNILKKIPDEKIADLTTSITPDIQQVTDQTTTLKIESPKNESFADNETIEIKGNTYKDAIVSLVSESDHAALKTDENGNFSTKFDLFEGGNNIYITSVNNKGQEEEANLMIFYTAEKM